MPDKESSEEKKSGNNMASFLLCFLKDGQLDATALSPPSHFDDFLRAAKRRRRKKAANYERNMRTSGRRRPAQPAKNKSIQYRFMLLFLL
jgi:hypothetical protein